MDDLTLPPRWKDAESLFMVTTGSLSLKDILLAVSRRRLGAEAETDASTPPPLLLESRLDLALVVGFM